MDAEWLVPNNEEARDLGHAQIALPNEVWRVLHRVAYVKRPALMGFGRSAVKRDEAADDKSSLTGASRISDRSSRVVPACLPASP